MQETYLKEVLLCLRQRHPLGEPGGAVGPPPFHNIRNG
jgi:hypothetical protein